VNNKDEMLFAVLAVNNETQPYWTEHRTILTDVERDRTMCG